MLITVCDNVEKTHSYSSDEGWDVTYIKYKSGENDYKSVRFVRIARIDKDDVIAETIEFPYPIWVKREFLK